MQLHLCVNEMATGVNGGTPGHAGSGGGAH